MTDKEKAKAYDEALAKCKAYIEDTKKRWSEEFCKATEKVFKEIFPQLAESEDERIRKVIYKIMLGMREEIFTSQDEIVTKEKIQDWIERQKEQKEIPLMNGDADLYFDNWIQHNDTTKRGCFEEGIKYAQRLQKEQKPADDKAFEEWIDDWYQGSKEAGGDIVMSEAEFKNWSRGIRNMYVEQKSAPISCSHENGTQAEWSEEDEEKLNNISEIIEHCTTIPYSGGTLTLNKFR